MIIKKGKKLTGEPKTALWFNKLNTGEISFIRIQNDGRESIEMTWGVYLEKDNPFERPTQFKVSAKNFNKLIEEAITRENIARAEL